MLGRRYNVAQVLQHITEPADKDAQPGDGRCTGCQEHVAEWPANPEMKDRHPRIPRNSGKTCAQCSRSSIMYQT